MHGTKTGLFAIVPHSVGMSINSIRDTAKSSGILGRLKPKTAYLLKILVSIGSQKRKGERSFPKRPWQTPRNALSCTFLHPALEM